jgi:hypothetical protein
MTTEFPLLTDSDIELLQLLQDNAYDLNSNDPTTRNRAFKLIPLDKSFTRRTILAAHGWLEFAPYGAITKLTEKARQLLRDRQPAPTFTEAELYWLLLKAGKSATDARQALVDRGYLDSSSTPKPLTDKGRALIERLKRTPEPRLTRVLIKPATEAIYEEKWT